MRFWELLRFALRGLRRQRARTILTTLGVAVGACSLAFSISLGVGLRDLVDREFHNRPGFWEIGVHPGNFPARAEDEQIPADAIRVEGEFDAERTARLRRQLIQRYWQNHLQRPPAMLTDESIARIAALPEVTEVLTARFGQGWAYWGQGTAFVSVVSGRSEQQMLAERLTAGRLPANNAAECIASEMLLYDLGIRSEREMQAALGTKLDIVFGERQANRFARDLSGNPDTTSEERAAAAKLMEQLPAFVDKLSLSTLEKQTLKEMLAKAVVANDRDKPPEGTFAIVGIVRAPTDRDEGLRGQYFFRWATLFTGGPASENFFRQLPHFRDGHYENAEVKVRPGSDLPATVEAIESMGFATNSAAEWFQGAKREVTLIGAGLNVFAIVSLLVAALGITNTLVTSVVERTQEIGILKAIGATGGQVRRIFLIEGMLIGCFGGAFGLLFARLLAGPADEFVKHQVAKFMRGNEMLTTTVFDFPFWLSLATPVFAALVTTLAALYPSHRAAKIAPIEALRYG